MAEVAAVNDAQVIDGDEEITRDEAYALLEEAQVAYDEAKEDLASPEDIKALKDATDAIWAKASMSCAAISESAADEEASLAAIFNEKYGLKELAEEVAAAEAFVDSFSDEDEDEDE